MSRALLSLVPLLAHAASLPDAVRFTPGPVNSVIVAKNTAVYSAGKSPGIVTLLLTGARRDAIGTIPSAARTFAPQPELSLLANPQAWWETHEKTRFHDYAQKSARLPVQPLPNLLAAREAEPLEPAPGIRIKAISTPGYEPNGISWIIETPDGRRIACTGDLIYGTGQIRDLYSLQDAIPEAKARGYHGYAARAGALIASLRRVAALKPDILLPAHGPAIQDPQRAIALLIERLQIFLESHFETDALRWYWGDDNHRIRSRAVERSLDIMPMAETSKLPPDILPIGNSRLILSKTGSGFLVDAGYSKLLPELLRLRAEGRLRTLDGIWITHYHDDHTDYVNDVSAAFNNAPVYFTQSMAEVIGNPSAFRLPCLTTKPIPVHNAKRDGETLKWNEWELTFWNFPGQTLYHGGLVARRADGERQTYLFVGDSFTPSGMDDYCMQNRDFLRPGEGYQYCLRKIATLPPNTWLMNQHVEPMFRYTSAQVQRMQQELTARTEALRQLSPWPDPNYMLDESWARAWPYAQSVPSGGTVRVALRITNHAPSPTTYNVKWNIPVGWQLLKAPGPTTISSTKDGSVEAEFRTAGRPGLHVITADVTFGARALPAIAETLVRLE